MEQLGSMEAVRKLSNHYLPLLWAPLFVSTNYFCDAQVGPGACHLRIQEFILLFDWCIFDAFETIHYLVSLRQLKVDRSRDEQEGLGWMDVP
jgi:hypothetical protein